ncbi:hypothetical protein J7I94_22290 [Streptomyces sp. ISL-12]|uniref:hypothetical protein n=1 Tax=Streptomyces sp. ISL-12 TaxID=2819177 RepID=UPI001BE51B90|nr:hypothetical protein [Streptomyces sp. ISL-12]MBT2413256.1 hypothetical protein [Streptomyces sp. ISL-12]
MSLGDEHQSSGGYGGTRTRLPEGDADPYGSPRRGGRSSSRSLVTVVGVVVVLIAAIAFANRGGDDSATSAESADKPSAAATAPTGKQPVRSGFAHDEQGAQSAAANYAVTLGSTGMFTKDTRHEIVDALYTRDAAAALKAPMDAAYSAGFLARLGLNADGEAPKGSTFVSRVTPLGTSVEKYGDGDARVAVWYMGLLGTSAEKTTNPITSSWKTWTFDLRWTDGDWKIVKDTQKDGPAPVPGDDRAATSEEISKAIEEYGGFTYAR